MKLTGNIYKKGTKHPWEIWKHLLLSKISLLTICLTDNLDKLVLERNSICLEKVFGCFLKSGETYFRRSEPLQLVVPKDSAQLVKTAVCALAVSDTTNIESTTCSLPAESSRMDD